MDKPKYYITTSIAYANAAPHIGFALELIYADVLARHMRLAGKEVRFLTGTDEHGQKIARKAAEAGKAPQEFTDQISDLFRVLAKRLDISNTDFIRTTEARHAAPVEKFWKLVDGNGYIYKKIYAGLYCVGCEAFKTEKELVDGKCPDHGIVPEYVEDENYFFRLSDFQGRLKELYQAQPDFVVPEAHFNEVRQLVESGLEDISISRSRKRLDWGMPVPGDDSQVIYVWFDALINYLTAAGFASDEKEFKKSWPADLHVIGKDINRFHTVLWPAMLMAAGIELPKQVAVHGWIQHEGKKMSKTLGNVVTSEELLDAFGVDGTRYLLLHEVPFRGDGDYSRAKFTERFNSNLANNLGNLVNRTWNMASKYRAGKVPPRADDPFAWSETKQEYLSAMAGLEFDSALQMIWGNLVDSSNQLIEQAKPWRLAKEGKDAELDRVLYQLLENVRLIGWLLRPLLPETSDKILDQLGQAGGERDTQTWDQVLHWGLLEPGTKINSGEQLFPRIET